MVFTSKTRKGIPSRVQLCLQMWCHILQRFAIFGFLYGIQYWHSVGKFQDNRNALRYAQILVRCFLEGVTRGLKRIPSLQDQHISKIVFQKPSNLRNIRKARNVRNVRDTLIVRGANIENTEPSGEVLEQCVGSFYRTSTQIRQTVRWKCNSDMVGSSSKGGICKNISSDIKVRYYHNGRFPDIGRGL